MGDIFEAALNYTMLPLALAMALMLYLKIVHIMLWSLGVVKTVAAAMAWAFLMALMGFLRRCHSAVKPHDMNIMAEAVVSSLLPTLAKRGTTWLVIGTLAATITNTLLIGV